jgi:hypothetical protein
MAWSRPRRLDDGRFDCGQIGLVKMYAKYAGLANQDYRALLKEHTGKLSSTDPDLGQYEFDVVMPALEIRAHLAEINGRAVGSKPARIRDWYYWRKRCPKTGMVNSRELWKINKLWSDLKPYVSESGHDDHAYLCSISGHACGSRIQHLHELKQWQALALIEALKDRLKYAIRKVASQ